MPRHFTEEEREQLKGRFLEKGKELFNTYGFKKTNIDDVVRHVGVSKGTFYAFYSSKEEFFVEILLVAERRAREILTERLFQSELPIRDAFVEAMYEQLTYIQDTPILRVLTQPDEYRFLIDSLDAEQIDTLFVDDRVYVEKLLREAQEMSGVRPVDVDAFTGLMRGVTLLTLHKREIGPNVFSGSLRLLLTMIAEYLFPQEEARPRERGTPND